MPAWNSIFKAKGEVFEEPILEINGAIKLMKKSKAKRVLDLGCGSGRHTILLAKEGFDVYGLDNAPEGLKLTRERLKKLGLKARLKNADCYEKLPYYDRFFDAVISTQTINHNYHGKIQGCISEIERVLKPCGIVFVTVASKHRIVPREGSCTKFKMVAPRTYLLLNGWEKGIPHFLYSKALLKKDFGDFEILELSKDFEKRKYCLLGKKRINLSKTVHPIVV